jgi:GNAT superfamily N-acetyltransferase
MALADEFQGARRTILFIKWGLYVNLTCDRELMALNIPEQEFKEHGGIIRYGIVPWDSRIFGFTVVEVLGIEADDTGRLGHLVPSFERFLKSISCRVVCVKVPAGKKEIFYGLQKNGYAFVEETVTPCIVDLQKVDFNYRNFIRRPLVPATADKLEEIKGIAYKTFKHDRFHADGGFGNDKASERYAYWVDNSFYSGDDVLYLELEGTVVGFSIVTRSGDSAHLALMGLGDAHKGRGLGVGLLAGTCQHTKDEGVKKLTARLSLNNTTALNLYSKCGFRFKDPAYVLHKWM